MRVAIGDLGKERGDIAGEITDGEGIPLDLEHEWAAVLEYEQQSTFA